jgi:hypothetical protein
VNGSANHRRVERANVEEKLLHIDYRWMHGQKTRADFKRALQPFLAKAE